jgi:hypothetical protein
MAIIEWTRDPSSPNRLHKSRQGATPAIEQSFSAEASSDQKGLSGSAKREIATEVGKLMLRPLFALLVCGTYLYLVIFAVDDHSPGFILAAAVGITVVVAALFIYGLLFRQTLSDCAEFDPPPSPRP